MLYGDANYAQPVTEVNYSTYVPDRLTPFDNALIPTMAHVYPEDRGTNYAVREGLFGGRLGSYSTELFRCGQSVMVDRMSSPSVLVAYIAVFF